mmetsp:Transcript_50090/g.160360  ORF Transcript_50090/g.160360 Transcript_50090/m.160360 type:complete len:507 (+) Transcript_50090:355-1875(+)
MEERHERVLDARAASVGHLRRVDGLLAQRLHQQDALRLREPVARGHGALAHGLDHLAHLPDAEHAALVRIEHQPHRVHGPQLLRPLRRHNLAPGQRGDQLVKGHLVVFREDVGPRLEGLELLRELVVHPHGVEERGEVRHLDRPPAQLDGRQLLPLLGCHGRLLLALPHALLHELVLLEVPLELVEDDGHHEREEDVGPYQHPDDEEQAPRQRVVAHRVVHLPRPPLERERLEHRHARPVKALEVGARDYEVVRGRVYVELFEEEHAQHREHEQRDRQQQDHVGHQAQPRGQHLDRGAERLQVPRHLEHAQHADGAHHARDAEVPKGSHALDALLEDFVQQAPDVHDEVEDVKARAVEGGVVRDQLRQRLRPEDDEHHVARVVQLVREVLGHIGVADREDHGVAQGRAHGDPVEGRALHEDLERVGEGRPPPPEGAPPLHGRRVGPHVLVRPVHDLLPLLREPVAQRVHPLEAGGGPGGILRHVQLQLPRLVPLLLAVALRDAGGE